jgi:CHAT domain-containing protein
MDQTFLARRAIAEVLDPTRGERLTPLPGTGREVRAAVGLLPGEQTTLLLGKEATESALQKLAQSGQLKTCRYIHLATHGKANPDVAMSSALYLAAEPERPASADPEAQLDFDGRITAEQIVRTWELDADLVVLSACESGLGRYAGGEGYLGFAQALFVKGARSLVLSLWRVDDVATALLMERFYRDLLGRRAGLDRPMPKAAALAEAKAWLRSLTREEARRAASALPAGKRVVEEDEGPKPRQILGASDRPYEHPYYWSAFILVGDAN